MAAKTRKRIPWDRLMALGLGGLRLAPEAFWAMTPRELASVLGATRGARPMDRDRLDGLMRRFPDHRKDK
ncbi:phage tail assembly chaperone [Nitratireductor mangrovi]|uniref:Phage tail assembly chaperone n=1 Tax=Nitratireductor mangrovi TaxID=2599600 RepID=A0A5B8KZU3_9HYPH|nr:rcc01693 family protein [Nitratireductor mangrovi]QDZ01121.1 phage tail assembly chaperone [Nitratireductor mangrovi]